MLPIVNTDRSTTERSTSDNLGNVSWVKKAVYQKECATLPHVQVLDSVYQAFPALVLQATNAGVRRPRYEASIYNCMSMLSIHLESTDCSVLVVLIDSVQTFQNHGLKHQRSTKWLSTLAYCFMVTQKSNSLSRTVEHMSPCGRDGHCARGRLSLPIPL